MNRVRVAHNIHACMHGCKIRMFLSQCHGCLFFFRGGDSFATTGSPLGSGFSKKQKRKTPRLSVMPLCVLACCHFEDRACPVCYYCYLRKFLKRKDRWALFLIAKNCECDFIDDDVKDGKPENESRFFENSSASPTEVSDEA